MAQIREWLDALAVRTAGIFYLRPSLWFGGHPDDCRLPGVWIVFGGKSLSFSGRSGFGDQGDKCDLYSDSWNLIFLPRVFILPELFDHGLDGGSLFCLGGSRYFRLRLHVLQTLEQQAQGNFDGWRNA